jgi:hypothetical protein
MSREIAPLRALRLTFPSWFLWIALGVLGATSGCGAKELGGAGGTGGGGQAVGAGGATGGKGGSGSVGGGSAGVGGGSGTGGTGGVGGAICPPPLSTFGCATTYDKQLTGAFCTSGGRISAGRCGTGWAWHCASVYSQDCIYDADKNLIAAKHCDDAPPLIEQCPETGPYCLQSSGFGADGGPGCDLYNLPDGGADLSDAGADAAMAP